MFANAFLNFQVSHFDPESQLGLLGYIVVNAVGAFVVQQDDGSVKVAFRPVESRHQVVLVLVNVDSVGAVRHRGHGIGRNLQTGP